jgi:uracil-DNA glycosylase
MNDPTRFDLDDRQRAMLAEMGVRVWWPQGSDAASQVAAGAAPATANVSALPARPAVSVPVQAPATRPATREPVVATAPAPVQAQAQGQGQVFAPLHEGLSSMGWDDLQMAVQSCQSCGLCASRQAPILGTSPGTGLGTARWMVVGDMPSEADEPSGQPFKGPEGELLDNMLKAVGVRRQGLAVDPALLVGQNAQAAHQGPAEACLTHAVKCRPSSGRNPEAAELATCAGYLSRQVALAQPQVILAMGRFAIQTLLGTTEPMGKLRGTVHRYQGVPVVVTYPPASLLRTQSDKAKAWADLVLALSVAKA